MREGWKEIDFLDSFEKVTNTPKISKKNFLNKGKYPIVSQEIKNINGFWNNENDVFRVYKPVIIFGDHTKRIKYIDFDFVLGADGVKIFLPINSLNSKFYYYQLSSFSIPHLGYARHYRLLKNFKIKIPPLPEQKQIVTLLDQAFGQIDLAKAKLEQNLRNAKELFESKLNEVFSQRGEGWVEKRLGDVCAFVQGIQRGVKLQSETKKNNQVRFLRIVDYTQGNELPRYIDFPGENYILDKDDIALVRYGASTGFVCRGLEGALANNLFRVIPKDTIKLRNDFLFLFLNSPLFQGIIKSSMNGAAMPAISFGMIKDIPIWLVPEKEQELIIKKIEKLKKETQTLQTHYQQKLNNLEELKKSILEKAFKGELDYRG